MSYDDRRERQVRARLRGVIISDSWARIPSIATSFHRLPKPRTADTMAADTNNHGALTNWADATRRHRRHHRQSATCRFGAVRILSVTAGPRRHEDRL